MLKNKDTETLLNGVIFYTTKGILNIPTRYKNLND